VINLNQQRELHTKEKLHTDFWLPGQQHQSLTSVYMTSTVIWVVMLCSSVTALHLEEHIASNFWVKEQAKDLNLSQQWLEKCFLGLKFYSLETA
jgi:hypothetical protein